MNYFALVSNSVKEGSDLMYTTDTSTATAPNTNHHHHHHHKQPQQSSKNTPIGYLIDLPGYGYASAPTDKVDAWQASTQSFLLSRLVSSNLTRLYILIDARRGPDDIDRTVMGYMDEAGLPYTIVLTKGDWVSRPEQVRVANELALRYHANREVEGCQGPFVHVVSF